jgi:hypothetical protein
MSALTWRTRTAGAAAMRALGSRARDPIHSALPNYILSETITSAMHNLVERILLETPEGTQEAYVLATNVYMRTAQGWRMVAHHASPGTPQEMLAHIDALPSVLH